MTPAKSSQPTQPVGSLRSMTGSVSNCVLPISAADSPGSLHIVHSLRIKAIGYRAAPPAGGAAAVT